MVGTPFTQAFAPLPVDGPARLAKVADRIAFGSDVPNIPYPYREQLRAIELWAADDDRLGAPFLRDGLSTARGGGLKSDRYPIESNTCSSLQVA
jgi:hypothetical protein